MFCEKDPHYVTNITCFIKAVRGKQGLINLIYYFQNMPKNDTWVQTKLFFRNSGGHFLPYLIDDDLNFCTIKKELKSNIPSIKALLVKFCSQVANMTFIAHGCPLKVGAHIVDLNFEDIKEKFFPPTIPEGRFFLYWRLYFKQSNHTFFEIKQHFVVKSTGITQLSMLNMG